ncbi:IS1634 family transposase [Lactobacillus sp. ESL0791]|uniref:IS1634 family transposase n=1 Tax=Lactobacillus sp. ESL0791 TaxID=2983234 RepID=UPI0023F8C1DE|nr:IS1634 family transposase [Lactobacillus sp. ESL0791]MDF7638288.1 IS1634 family transposase [Lactobacillus sp. ESL0791]
MMRIRKNISTNSVSYSVIESYRDLNGKATSRVVEALGNEAEILKKHPGVDPEQWARNYAKELTRKKKSSNLEIMVKYRPNRLITKNNQLSYNVGYLFLQSIYYQLGLGRAIDQIQRKHDFKFDLNDIFSKLIYLRVLDPASKRGSLLKSHELLENMTCSQHDLYRALDVLQQESHTLQTAAYHNSQKLLPRQKKILYYDCTNYYFEIEQEDEFRRYGHSKENRPNPIVQMGLFMDGSGLPLAFSTFPGNENEQPSLQKLEKKVLKDFDLSEVIVVTDGGLSSKANRLFNSRSQRSFVTTQSIKKLPKYLKDWCLASNDWHLKPKDRGFNLEQINEQAALDNDLIYFKERWIKDNTGFEQHLVVTFSIKYKLYEQEVRQRQFERAKQKVKTPSKLKAVNPNDPKRFIKQTATTKDGEVAAQKHFMIDTDKEEAEAQYDGFYAVCTNLEEDPLAIIKVNRSRWETEDSFRVMKSELRSRPVYLQREARISAHFLICFMALLVLRIIERKLKKHVSIHELITCLNEMKVVKLPSQGYTPTYERTDLTDALHEVFGFRTDYELIPEEKLKKIILQSKKGR